MLAEESHALAGMLMKNGAPAFRLDKPALSFGDLRIDALLTCCIRYSALCAHHWTESRVCIRGAERSQHKDCDVHA